MLLVKSEAGLVVSLDWFAFFFPRGYKWVFRGVLEMRPCRVESNDRNVLKSQVWRELRSVPQPLIASAGKARRNS